RDVHADDLRAVARQDLGDGRADAAGSTGDDGDLAFRRLIPVSWCGGCGVVDADDLGVDVGGLAGEQEAQGGLQAGEVAGKLRADVDQLGGCAATQRLGHGAAGALEAALGDGRVGGLGQLRGGAQNDNAAVRGELAHHRVEEVEELVELLWLGDAGRVEDEGGVLAVTGVAGQVVVRIQQGGD